MERSGSHIRTGDVWCLLGASKNDKSIADVWFVCARQTPKIDIHGR